MPPSFSPKTGLRNSCKNAYLSGSVELPRALSLALGKFPQQVLVGPAQDVRLDIVQAQAVPTQNFHKGGKAVVIHDPLARSGGVELGQINDALKFRVLSSHRADRIGQILAQARCPLPNGRPAGIFWKIELEELVVQVNELSR